MMNIQTIDLNFVNRKGEIAAYLIQSKTSVIIIDPGPETTIPQIGDELRARGLTFRDVTHILLTHIHLDHAGAVGWFAHHGAMVYVHPLGAPHMLNPEKLIKSAARLYGEWMEKLWGDIKPVPTDHLVSLEDGEEIHAGDVNIEVLFTPGHADHHVVYKAEDILFSGDVGGTRFQPSPYLRLPFVPPETNIEKWRNSLEYMKRMKCRSIAPTHFGIYQDAKDHLDRAIDFLEQVNVWLKEVMPGISDVNLLATRYGEYLNDQARKAEVEERLIALYDGGNPVTFAAEGLFRYWNKEHHRT